MSRESSGAPMRSRAAACARAGSRAAFAAAVASLLLAACGGGGGTGTTATPPTGTGATAPSQNDYFPLAAGDRWLYAVTDHDVPVGLYQMDVAGTTTVDGQAVVALLDTDLSGGALGQGLYRSTAAGVTVFPAAGSNRLTTAIGPFDVFRLPATAGSSYVQIDKSVEIDDVDFTVHAVVETIGFEASDVPAGHFQASLHVRTTLSENVKYLVGASAFTYVYDDWYVDGVGRVRSEFVETEDISHQVAAWSHEELQAYRSGNRRGGAVPQVRSVLPSADAVSGGAAQVSATFDAPMDAGTLKSGGMRVVDAANADVPGYVTVAADGLSAVFAPAAAWRSGTYTAMIGGGATDRMGNAAAARSWTFKIDAVAPAVALATPADGATGVNVVAPIVVVFSEPVSFADGRPALEVTDETTGESLQLLADVLIWFVDATTLDIAPAVAWKRGHRYTVHFDSGIQDSAGNSMAPGATLHFTAAAGLLAAPQPFLSTADTPVMADVDGDRLPDLVYAAIPDGDSDWGIVMRAGLRDGTFAPQTTLVHGPLHGNCGMGYAPSSIAVGDLNGDGRADLAYVGFMCSGKVMLQTAGGGFVEGITLANSSQTVVRIADIDGDGRNDLATSDVAFRVDIWLQDANGALVPKYDPELWFDFQSVDDIRFVDLDGDGRADLVARMAGGKTVVRFQSADGTFSDTGTILGNFTQIAVGDVNGDGRPDIVGTSGSFIVVIPQLAGQTFGASQAAYPTGPRTMFQEPPNTYAVAIADLDRDGRLDVVATTESSGVLVFLQRPDGTLAMPDPYDGKLGSRASHLLVADLDADGRPDVLEDDQLFPNIAPSGAAPSATQRRAAQVAPPPRNPVVSVTRLRSRLELPQAATLR